MTEVVTDDRGRVTIPKEMRERFGERYRLVGLRADIELLAVPDDSLAALRDAASGEFEEASTDELRDAAREQARRRADEHGR